VTRFAEAVSAAEQAGTGSPQPARGGQLPSLTGMRWAAALLVFLYHVGRLQYFGQGQGFVVWAFGPGAAGVSFFFILSGFVLAWTARPGDRPTAFWHRRLARIYPVHLVTAILALVLGLTLVPVLRPTGIAEVAANLFLVSSWKLAWWQALNPVSWSLTCEAFFYALFPLLYLAVRRVSPRVLGSVIVVCAAVVVALPWFYLQHSHSWSLSSFPAVRLPEFVLGVAAGRLVQLGRWRGPGIEASLALTLVGYFLVGQLTDYYQLAAGTVIGLSLLVPAAATADLDGLPSMWRHPWLVRLGEWSFAFYMIHILVMRIGERLFEVHPRLHLPQALGATAAAFLISLGLAWALHELVEKPARRRLLHGSRRGRSTGPIPPADAVSQRGVRCSVTAER
jgi:peptidoglycan/LPS O-acetylase OafA/YrhL